MSNIATRLSLLALPLFTVGLASATTLVPLQLAGPSPNDPTLNYPFPTAGDAYTSATNGNGTIPVGGSTAFQWTAGDSVTSAIFSVPTTALTDLTANWQYMDFIGGGNSETWFVYVNGTAVAQATLPDDNFNGDVLSVTGTVNFAPIAPVAGGYQVELILQNTLPFGDGSIAWNDGGITGLSFSGTPEPGSLTLLGAGLLAVAAVLRRKRSCQL